MKLTEEQISTINTAGGGCYIIQTGITPDAAEDKKLPTNAYLMECEKDGDIWFDVVMGDTVGIFDTYYDLLGNVIKKMSYCKGTRPPHMWNATPPKKQKEKPPKRKQ